MAPVRISSKLSSKQIAAKFKTFSGLLKPSMSLNNSPDVLGWQSSKGFWLLDFKMNKILWNDAHFDTQNSSPVCIFAKNSWARIYANFFISMRQSSKHSLWLKKCNKFQFILGNRTISLRFNWNHVCNYKGTTLHCIFR